MTTQISVHRDPLSDIVTISFVPGIAEYLEIDTKLEAIQLDADTADELAVEMIGSLGDPKA